MFCLYSVISEVRSIWGNMEHWNTGIRYNLSYSSKHSISYNVQCLKQYKMDHSPEWHSKRKAKISQERMAHGTGILHWKCWIGASCLVQTNEIRNRRQWCKNSIKTKHVQCSFLFENFLPHTTHTYTFKRFLSSHCDISSFTDLNHFGFHVQCTAIWPVMPKYSIYRVNDKFDFEILEINKTLAQANWIALFLGTGQGE